MIYFDSNTFIYELIYETVKDVKKADNYLIQFVRGEIMGYTLRVPTLGAPYSRYVPAFHRSYTSLYKEHDCLK